MNKNPTGGWKKGQSGNPKGRPKLTRMAPEILRAIGAEIGPDRKTKREAMLRALYDLALTGDMDAMKLILERTEGKVTDKMELSGGASLTIVEELVAVAPNVA